MGIRFTSAYYYYWRAVVMRVGDKTTRLD